MSAVKLGEESRWRQPGGRTAAGVLGPAPQSTRSHGEREEAASHGAVLLAPDLHGRHDIRLPCDDPLALRTPIVATPARKTEPSHRDETRLVAAQSGMGCRSEEQLLLARSSLRIYATRERRDDELGCPRLSHYQPQHQAAPLHYAVVIAVLDDDRPSLVVGGRQLLDWQELSDRKELSVIGETGTLSAQPLGVILLVASPAGSRGAMSTAALRVVHDGLVYRTFLRIPVLFHRPHLPCTTDTHFGLQPCDVRISRRASGAF
uniref:Uncharacterized protein n=1 Tax=Mycena chlorophos TaxID=658473 RepID=A0ABQ0LZJ0_MYCCL|nr:predicted protein [Mycena chlorophos]